MQFFHRSSQALVAGINEVIEILTKAIPNRFRAQTSIKAVIEGTIVAERQPVLEITGPYAGFGYLEGIIDGLLARRSTVATNALQLVLAAKGKSVVYMADRMDDFINQPGDGYAARIGGMDSFITEANYARQPKRKLYGTMPHALIQQFEGNLVQALIAYKTAFPNEPLVALIDYHNDCLSEARKALAHFGKELTAVRVDTASDLIDVSLQKLKGSDLNGVNPTLTKMLRAELDRLGGQHVKIIATSGLTAERISDFEQQDGKVDIYGVGTALTSQKVFFTGDAVLLDGANQAKHGRKILQSEQLIPIKLWKK
ncbi:unnamed protein product [Didymodactylos carnosus]|uniref:nicotinate phosphoribosyltransferase n=1 Tax=Didymodactylos carnosus TaxID=1234261 RepID=A0A8S2CQW8_9BILA|nr:unnamed protein product [Didymodactylos carnosus]CAF3491756.1 unnamed protein product [Didymodactylos carnosus]